MGGCEFADLGPYQQAVIPFGLPVILRSGREGVQIEGKDCDWSEQWNHSIVKRESFDRKAKRRLKDEAAVEGWELER